MLPRVDWLRKRLAADSRSHAARRRVEQVRAAVELCRTHGIQTGMFLMWGYEGEELDDIEPTVQHVKKTQPDVFLTTVSYPIKGTPYYEETASKLVGIGDWGQSSDRDLRLRGRHSRRYYEFADLLLKSEVALEKAIGAHQRRTATTYRDGAAGLSKRPTRWRREGSSPDLPSAGDRRERRPCECGFRLAQDGGILRALPESAPPVLFEIH